MADVKSGLAQLFLVIGLLVFAPLAFAQTAPDDSGGVQDTETSRPVDWSILTNSPADTLASFQRMSRRLQTVVSNYRKEKTRANREHVALITEQMIALIDLSQVARMGKRDKGVETVASLLDVFSRIGFPNAGQAPDAQDGKTDNHVAYSVPGTPFRIVQITDGSRAGEWLFESRTVESAPSFLRGVSTLPVGKRYQTKDWSLVLKQATGPMIPDSFVAAIPTWLKQPFLGTLIWKAIAALAIVAPTAFLLVKWVRSLPKPEPDGHSSRAIFTKILGPLGVNLVMLGIFRLLHYQLNLTGILATIAGVASSVIFWGTFAWAFWLLTVAFSEKMIEKPNISEGSIDANMVRLCARIIALVGTIVILSFGAQTIGIPVLSLLAGLGIGGIAVALAARPTLENLIGGIILFLDKPIRIGEYCSFGDKSGTVERIGARSAQIRALDRTTITIPNSRFADMEIINWSKCDRMHLNQTIGLRYETQNDQLIYILAKIREMFHAHPKIDGATGRALFVGYSDTSLNIVVQAYVDTPYWTEYFAVREDALLRVKDIIERSGTSYAVPTSTVYYQRDPGVDKELGRQVKEEVDSWRADGEFPFPRFSDDIVESFKGKIIYPVPGSPDYIDEKDEATANDEK